MRVGELGHPAVAPEPSREGLSAEGWLQVLALQVAEWFCLSFQTCKVG